MDGNSIGNEKTQGNTTARPAPAPGRNDSVGGLPTMGGAPEGSLGRIDRYVLKRKLGQGGFGAVYLAEDTEAGIEVALKALPGLIANSPEELERVRANFALVQKLHHPNIAALQHLHKVSSADRTASEALRVLADDYLVVMECAEGSTLSSWRHLFPDGKVPVEQALSVCSRIASALDYAHGEKIVHRDIKPANVMVAGEGDSLRVKVLDFGLAAEIRSSMGRVSKDTGETSGTRPYMSPEQWAGKRQGAPTDQYALAVLFHELVSGEVPFASAFETNDPIVMARVAEEKTPDPLPELSKRQNAAMLRALSKNPEERFASCGDFVAALGGAKLTTKSRSARRGKWGWVFALMLLVVLGLVSHRSYQSHRSRLAEAAAVEQAAAEKARQAAAEQAALDAAQRAKVAELSGAVRSALISGDLKTAGERLAELAVVAGDTSSLVAELRAEYEGKAGERETNIRYAAASVERDRAAELDRGQTFGPKLDALEIKWREAEAARQGKSWGQALSAYDAVLAQCKALHELDTARTAASAERANAEQARRTAAGANAAVDAKELFATAGGTASRADQAFESGDFPTAGKTWTEAAALFGQSGQRARSVQAYARAKTAYETASAAEQALLEQHGGERWQEVLRQSRIGAASGNDPVAGADAYAKALTGLPEAVAEARPRERAAQIEDHVASARRAKEAGRWADVVSAAGKALELDANNREALALKQEGEANQIPTWKLVATVDGREVPATITMGVRTFQSPHTFTLEAGGRYETECSYESEGRRYRVHPLSVRADWKGEREQRIMLEEVRGPMTGRNATVDGVGLELVWIAPGAFSMGSSTNEDGRRDDEVQHRVMLTRGYWLGKYELTQAEYEAVMGNNPSRFKGMQNPVESVSWDAAIRFCRRLTERERLAGRLPDGYEYRLPTEAEWEYAARGGGQSRGFTHSGSNSADEVAWHGTNSGYVTHPVGQKSPNELGLFDMSGNVGEWCLDWYDDNYSGSSGTDPAGPGSGSRRVCRGGGWSCSAVACRAAGRDWSAPTLSNLVLGFRVALAARVSTVAP
jgi:formylglycine-generating enzyme required for sulfatase activity/serine/threonine protein kinase